MSKIKVAELFYSIQGEGRYMGVPSVFLRTFGCNFTCDGFGMPAGHKSQERHHVAALDKSTAYSTYNHLPLVSTGCDSYASWMPEFKHLSSMVKTDSLAESIVNLLPHKEWRDEHLVITGGEPLLGWQRAYPNLLNHIKMRALQEITFETNGTQPLTAEFRKFLHEWQTGSKELTFSVSPKLSVSGEAVSDAIRPDIVQGYQQVGYTYLKFVVASQADVVEALDTLQVYRGHGFTGPAYLMPVGGVESVYNLNNKLVAELAMKAGLRYSDRLQVPLFHNAWGT